jgi:hypothetical protein
MNKEAINAVLCHPYPNKLVVTVYRQLDRFHMPISRLYSAQYSEPERVRRLSYNFLRMNCLVQERIVERNIKYWKDKMNES